MRFNDQLNSYIELTSTTHKELAVASGLSEATISRYCSGERAPSYQSDQIIQLARAISKIGETKECKLPPYEGILDSLNETVRPGLQVEHEVFLSNLNHLLNNLGIRVSELARGIHNDSSHISKILSGTRRPGDVDNFIFEVSSYIARRYSTDSDIKSIANTIDANPEDVSTQALLRDEITKWLGSAVTITSNDSFPHFLSHLDNFDLNDYLKSVHFDDIKVPPATPHLPTRKEYLGIQKMMDGEIDFMKTTVLSKSQDDCILYSDMPLEDMAADPEFPKKYMLGMAMMLKKGLHINMIHDVNRPFSEMMLGLESWIPLYMTGQISPYYLPASQSQVFLHFLKVSGAAALEGSAISGNQASGKYVLYRSKEDIKHYQTRAKQLLKKAQPLMEIYQEGNKGDYPEVRKDLLLNNDCKMICSNIPVYFLSEELLWEILDEGKVKQKTRTAIMSYHEASRKSLIELLGKKSVHLIIPAAYSNVGTSDTPDYVPRLSLADLFIDDEIALSNLKYDRFMKELNDLQDKYQNFSFECNPSPSFHNINIAIIENKRVIVSKEKSPTIHFVIHHKKMIEAFQNYVPPLVDKPSVPDEQSK